MTVEPPAPVGSAPAPIDLLPSAEDAARWAGETTADQWFVDWLASTKTSLVVALRPGMVTCLGAKDGDLTVSNRPIGPPLGLAVDGTRLAIATRREITVFVASRRLAPHFPDFERKHDAVFIPVSVLRTGECMTHDMAFDGPSVVFANTQFSCLARADGMNSFVELWRPPFISALFPQDRCHLNSFAVDGTRIRYACAFAPSDEQSGYRSLPIDSGVVIDVESNAIVVAGLIKPHSVRIFDDELYVLNSAAGEVLRVDLNARTSTCLVTLPGFARGLRLHDGVLLVGLSKMRASARTLNLPLSARESSLLAGIAAVDPRSGHVLGVLKFSAEVDEVFDIVVVPGLTHAAIIDASPDAPVIGIETPSASYWMAAGRDLRKPGFSASAKPVIVA